MNSVHFTSNFYTQDEPEKCEICGKICKLFGGVCDGCIDEHRNDFELCKEISIGEDESIELNAIYTALLSKEQIESILSAHIREHEPNIDCSAFIDTDRWWFGERLARELTNKK